MKYLGFLSLLPFFFLPSFLLMYYVELFNIAFITDSQIHDTCYGLNVECVFPLNSSVKGFTLNVIRVGERDFREVIKVK